MKAKAYLGLDIGGTGAKAGVVDAAGRLLALAHRSYQPVATPEGYIEIPIEQIYEAARAATRKHEFLSCFGDFHGKSGHAVSLARMGPAYGSTRAPGFYMVPRPDPYRPWFKKADGAIDTDAYLNFYDEFIREGTTGQVAAIVLEPIQGWAGVHLSPGRFLPQAPHVV
jgi:4-aminobutyrate aminotransferase-like enzyme